MNYITTFLAQNIVVFSIVQIYFLTLTIQRHILDQGWPDFSSYNPNFNKIMYCGLQKKLGLFFFKYDMIDVSLFYFLLQKYQSCAPKFDTGAAKNLLRAALWPPL